MFDCHIHTQHFSTDGEQTISECIATLQNLKLGGTITEHIDYGYPNPCEYVFDIDEYFNAFFKYRSDTLKLGVEVGMQHIVLDKNKELVKSHDFDLVIAAIHMLSGFDIYYEDFYKDKTKSEAYNIYFDTMLNCIYEFSDFDVLAHLDYITRYSPYDDKYIHYNEFKKYLDEILNYLVKNNKVLEINTRLFSDKVAVKVIEEILVVYKNMGGKYVTLGSDAHVATNLGMHFDTATNLANCYNLKTVYFDKRNMQYTPL